MNREGHGSVLAAAVLNADAVSLTTAGQTLQARRRQGESQPNASHLLSSDCE